MITLENVCNELDALYPKPVINEGKVTDRKDIHWIYKTKMFTVGVDSSVKQFITELKKIEMNVNEAEEYIHNLGFATQHIYIIITDTNFKPNSITGGETAGHFAKQYMKVAKKWVAHRPFGKQLIIHEWAHSFVKNLPKHKKDRLMKDFYAYVKPTDINKDLIHNFQPGYCGDVYISKFVTYFQNSGLGTDITAYNDAVNYPEHSLTTNTIPHGTTITVKTKAPVTLYSSYGPPKKLPAGNDVSLFFTHGDICLVDKYDDRSVRYTHEIRKFRLKELFDLDEVSKTLNNRIIERYQSRYEEMIFDNIKGSIRPALEQTFDIVRQKTTSPIKSVFAIDKELLKNIEQLLIEKAHSTIRKSKNSDESKSRLILNAIFGDENLALTIDRLINSYISHHTYNDFIRSDHNMGVPKWNEFRDMIADKLKFPDSYGLSNFDEFVAVSLEHWKKLPIPARKIILRGIFDM